MPASREWMNSSLPETRSLPAPTFVISSVWKLRFAMNDVRRIRFRAWKPTVVPVVSPRIGVAL